MKRIIPTLLMVLALGGCIRENAYCPVLYVSFRMEDPYMEGDYDSRIENDVLLYVFKDNTLTYKKLIPYASIAGGAEYAINKTDAILGEDIKLVAWAVPANRILSAGISYQENLAIHHDIQHPEYRYDSRFDEHYLAHIMPDAGARGEPCNPHPHERYIGRLNTRLRYKHIESHHEIIMHPAPGRIIVNINDPGGYLKDDPHVTVEGTMSHMSLDKKGYGTQVTVRTGISGNSPSRAGSNTHTTGIFGVLPSAQGQTLTVQIMDGYERLQTLVVHTDDNLHESIESGELLEFDYTLGSAEFTITVGEWTKKIYIVDGM